MVLGIQYLVIFRGKYIVLSSSIGKLLVKWCKILLLFFMVSVASHSHALQRDKMPRLGCKILLYALVSSLRGLRE